MIPLEDLVKTIQAAVVEAADQVRRKNIQILEEYFVPGDAEPSSSERPPLVPKRIDLEFPIVTEKGPGVHIVQVPLISLAPPTNLYLSEFRVRMHVEFDLDDRTAAGLRVRPARPTMRAVAALREDEAATPTKEVAEIEIVIKHGDDPSGLTDVVQGYDRALRAEIPG